MQDFAGAGLRPGTQSTEVRLLLPCIQEPEVRQQLQAAQSLRGDCHAVAHAQTLQPAAGPACQLWRNRLSCRWGTAGDSWLGLQTVHTLDTTLKRFQACLSEMDPPAVKVQATKRSPYVRSSSRASPNLVRDTFRACSTLLRPLAAIILFNMQQQPQQTGTFENSRAAGILHAVEQIGSAGRHPGAAGNQAAKSSAEHSAGRLSRLVL